MLAKIVAHLNEKPAPYAYLDTHAGIGLYDLGGEEAGKTGEWRNGVGRLRSKRLGEAAETLLAPWRAALGDSAETVYPGSPEIVRRLSRSGDRLRLCEKHPKDAALLARNLGHDRRVKTIEIDGWTALNAWLPPPERRGLVLIDPPFEQPGEHARMGAAFAKAWRKWRTGVFVLWSPIKDLADREALIAPILSAGVDKLLRAELYVRAPNDPKILSGSSLVIANPPWRLAGELDAGLPDLARALAQGEGASGKMEVLAIN